MKITHPVTRSAFGVAALVAIAVFANWLVSLTPLGNRGADFTEKQIHTLSDGTKAILGELDTPVVIRYYASRNTDYMPEDMKLHMRRVDDLVKEYASLSEGKLRIENPTPQPESLGCTPVPGPACGSSRATRSQRWEIRRGQPKPGAGCASCRFAPLNSRGNTPG